MTVKLVLSSPTRNICSTTQNNTGRDEKHVAYLEPSSIYRFLRMYSVYDRKLYSLCGHQTLVHCEENRTPILSQISLRQVFKDTYEIATRAKHTLNRSGYAGNATSY